MFVLICVLQATIVDTVFLNSRSPDCRDIGLTLSSLTCAIDNERRSFDAKTRPWTQPPECAEDCSLEKTHADAAQHFAAVCRADDDTPFALINGVIAIVFALVAVIGGALIWRKCCRLADASTSTANTDDRYRHKEMKPMLSSATSSARPTSTYGSS